MVVPCKYYLKYSTVVVDSHGVQGIQQAQCLNRRLVYIQAFVSILLFIHGGPKLFLVFKHDFISRLDFTHMPAANSK